MCGVVAILGLNQSDKVCSQDTLDRMTDKLAHRGPDGRGTKFLDNGRLAFGHRRLSIVDLDSTADQPFSDPSNYVHIVFNGEIYNHVALRYELEAQGAKFKTDHSDTEVIVQGFLMWGLDMLLDKLEGMFAFVLWDDRTKTLFAARDRIGIKPLYYTVQQERLILTSEIKALAALPEFRAAMNDYALIHLLSVLATPAPMTLFDGVFKLSAGHYLSWSQRDGLQKMRFWHPSRSNVTDFEVADLRETTFAHIQASVHSRIAEDVDTGVFLSGGVDSSILLGIASKRIDSMNAYTVGFEGDSPHNEFKAAEEVAKLFGANHHQIRINESDALKYLDKLIVTQDEPIADWVCVPLHFLSGLAQSNGSKVVLVGEGADELFAGYPGWHEFLYKSLVWKIPEIASKIGLGPALSYVFTVIGQSLPKNFLGLIGLADGLATTARGESRFWSGAMAFTTLQRMRLLNKNWQPKRPLPDPARSGTEIDLINSNTSAIFSRVEEAASDNLDELGANFRSMVYKELELRLPELLLMRVDKITMGSSIEARVPFLDHKLVNFMLSVNPNHILDPDRTTKPLLKSAVADFIPEHILSRPKQGFSAPMDTWLRGSFGANLKTKMLSNSKPKSAPFSHTFIEYMFDRHRKGDRNYAHYLWPAINIELWHRKWIGSSAIS